MDEAVQQQRVRFLSCVICTVLFLVLNLFSKSLYAYSPPKLNLDVQLTEKERQYLKLKTKLTHCDTPGWMPYSDNMNGKHIGIVSDYVDMFAKTLDIPIEFIPTTTWSETLSKAKLRECDFIAALVDKPERHQYLDFTDGYLDTSLALATHYDAPLIDNLNALDGKKVAAMKGYAATTYIKENFPNLLVVEIDDLDKGFELVEQKKLYGVVSSLGVLAYKIQNHYFNTLKLNGTFTGGWKQSVGSRSDEPLLHSIMSKVVSSIPQKVHQDIFTHWISESVLKSRTNALTLKETAYLTEHPKIRFRISSNRAPFDSVIDGKPQGLAVDYIKLIALKVGFEPEFVVMDLSPPDAIVEMQKEQPEFDTMAYWVAKHDREDLFVFGDAYLTYPVVIISNKDGSYINALTDLNFRKVVVEEGYLTADMLTRDYPLIEVIYASSTIDALRMVDEGKVDAYMGNLAIANYLIASGEMENIKVAAPTEYKNIEYRFVASSAQSELVSILSKGYRQITPSEHTAIRGRWFTMQKIETADYTLLINVLLGVAVIFVIGGLWHAHVSREKRHTEQALYELRKIQDKLQLKNDELQRLSITDALTGLNNRVRLEAILDKQVKSVARYPEHEFGVIMVDIDRFKSINDTYGHQVGDIVLKQVSLLFKQHIREVDYIGRWGGEEFLIVCTHANKYALVKVAEHLRKNLESYYFEKVGMVTASFGISTYTDSESVESLLARADRALYMSKDNGRNRVTVQ